MKSFLLIGALFLTSCGARLSQKNVTEGVDYCVSFGGVDEYYALEFVFVKACGVICRDDRIKHGTLKCGE